MVDWIYNQMLLIILHLWYYPEETLDGWIAWACEGKKIRDCDVLRGTPFSNRGEAAQFRNSVLRGQFTPYLT